jgi:hypothetical protein
MQHSFGSKHVIILLNKKKQLTAILQKGESTLWMVIWEYMKSFCGFKWIESLSSDQSP